MHKATGIASLLAVLGATFGGCGDGGKSASSDAGIPDAARSSDADMLGGDAAVQLGWVDFAVTGCASGEGSEPSPCIGPSPLTLRFTALAPAPIESQAWNFGDNSEPVFVRSPEHVFAAPGSYDVTLNVEGPGGTAGVTRLAAIVVIPAPLAAQCESDSHCASGDCACESPGLCPAVLADGMCVRSCTSHSNCGGNRCIDLDPSAAALEDWQRTTCLPACSPGGDECGPDKSCEALLDVDGLITHACFASGLLRPIGASCRDLDGALSDAMCASGVCLDKGDRGLCSFACDVAACPQGSGCASFSSGSPTAPHCLADCATTSCDADGQLSCVPSGGLFTVTGTASAAGYCAPTEP